MPNVNCDSFYFLAKKHGFRSRAAFKLIEIDRKYRILEKSSGIIDLCAAPGSWSQVSNKISPINSLIIGFDAQKIQPIKNCFFLRADVTSPNMIKMIKKIKEIDGRKINLVLHDGAPKIGACWLKDVLNQNELALLALKIGIFSLEKGGDFISKVFRSEFLHGILYVSNCFFRKVLLFKPTASRKSSTEIYLICINFKAPKKFDPFFFSSDYIFSFSQNKIHPRNAIHFKKNNTIKTKKNLLALIRSFLNENAQRKLNFKFDDEFESFFGISCLSKVFFLVIKELLKSTESNFLRILLKWSNLFITENSIGIKKYPSDKLIYI